MFVNREGRIMERKELLYTGKAKKMYATNQETVLLAEYLNQVTSLNGAKY